MRVHRRHIYRTELKFRDASWTICYAMVVRGSKTEPMLVLKTELLTFYEVAGIFTRDSRPLVHCEEN